MRAEHAPAARAQHVPGQIEQPESCRVKKAGDDLLLVEPAKLGEVDRVDAVELGIGTLLHEMLDRIGYRRVRGLSQQCKLGLDVTHGRNLSGEDRTECPIRPSVSEA